MLNDSARAIVRNCYSIVKHNEDFILADIRRNKDTKEFYYPTVAVYSNPLKLVADLTALLVKRATFLQVITNQDELLKEISEVAQACCNAINKLENIEAQ